MQMISPQQIPGLLQNDIMYMLIPEHMTMLSLTKRFRERDTSQHFSSYYNSKSDMVFLRFC